MLASDNSSDKAQTPSDRMPHNASINDEVFVLGTDITWIDLEERLRAALKTKANFGSNKRIERIGVGQGFMSAIGRLYPEWTREQDVLPRTFIVKIPSATSTKNYLKSSELYKVFEECDGPSEEEMFEGHERMIKTVHNTESGFYLINESLPKKLKAPKAFVVERFEEGKSKGLLILEDLCDAHIVPVYKNVSIDEAAEVIDALAEVHAYSLRTDSWLTLSSVTLKDLMTKNHQSTEGMMKVTELCAQSDPERLDERMNKLREIYSEVFDLDFEQNLYKEMGLKPVLVHGDLWSSNVLWKGEEGSRQLIVHPGCSAQDLARFISSMLSAEDRRKHWERLLERYYAKLEENLGRKPPFTLQQVKESFVRLLPFHMFLVLPTLGPLVLYHIKQTMPQQYDEIRTAMVDKAIALIDDIFYYHELNSVK
ncbi:unnamed protein product [Toxocara canis]|uniref:Putative oxidoreductase dhs-27 n=1 Tax=Toxocara canis TaxID=6265 RepID=A0A183V810_TOXCA|nr:unnamed protein product [Toxocara canis]